MTACHIWLRRDWLIRHGHTPDEPPCRHDPRDCPPQHRGQLAHNCAPCRAERLAAA